MAELPLRQRVQDFVVGLQERMCVSLEAFEPGVRFVKNAWHHKEGGGGETRVLENGRTFEKAAVNVSVVEGILPASIAQKFEVEPDKFFVTGISSIIHPVNPYVPTIHCNYRYFELKNGDAWFGGGIDLTPYYPFIEDVRLFHSVLKDVCDRSDPEFYARFKKWCDEYFYLPHRKEMRGVGGIFFDYLRQDLEKLFGFVQACGNSFFESYVAIVAKRKETPFAERERWWQSIRRGRYVEFNLLYDRGTRFGLETGGATESILLSMPPIVRWGYNVQPEIGSKEAELLSYLQPQDWLTE